MWTVNEEVASALKMLNLAESLIKQLDTNAADKIVEEAKKRFVDGNPRAWWLSLKTPFISHSYDFPSDYIVQYMSKHEQCYWIPESDEDKLIVYETYPEIIPIIMEEVPFFEYYVLSKDLKHLIIENDHNELIITQEIL